VTAAKFHGLWVPGDDSELHVDVPATASRLRTPTDHRRRLAEHPDDSIVLHWRSGMAREGDRLAVGVLDCVDQVFRCQGTEAGTIVLESALHRRRIRPDSLPSLLSLLRGADRGVARTASRLSESGTETMMRRGLSHLRVPYRQQVFIDGVGRVDFVVGDRLVVEVDSKEHHADPYRDRRRDALLSALGYRVLRFMYSQVVFEWSSVEQAILAALLRGDHLAA
jgi:very-short-patch-repair endonuclease